MSKSESGFQKFRRKSKKTLTSLFKFAVSSGIAVVIDYAIFLLLWEFLPFDKARDAVLLKAIATFGARAVSSLVNFYINRNVVFKDRKSPRKAMVRYYILCVIQAFNSFWMLTLVSSALAISDGVLLLVCKFAVECLLFCINFFVQRAWVFKK